MQSNHPLRAGLLQPCAAAVVLGGLLLVLGMLPGPAYSAAIDLNGTFSGNATITPTGTPGIYAESFTGSGTDSIYGAFTATATSTVDFSHPPSVTISNSMLSEVFMNGTLGGSSSGSGTGNGSGAATFTGDFMVDDGTGVFAGYTGDVSLSGTITLTGPTTASVSGTFAGTLATPEPATMALAIVGLALLSRRRAR